MTRHETLPPRRLAAVFAMAFALWAPAALADGVKVEEAWARASAGAARNGAAYLTLVNLGAAPDRLLAAASPVAEKAELHTHLLEDGVMRMRPVTAVEVHPGTPTVLRPGGLHVMLFGLKAPLEDGQRFPLSLRFEKAGTVEVEVAVRRDAPAGQGQHRMH